MILVTHAITGSVAALLFPTNPSLGLAVALASHFVTDAIPHWHYPLRSLERRPGNPLAERLHFGRDFWRDLLTIGSECAAGVILGGWLGYQASPDLVWLAGGGAVFGVLPDFMQLLYHLYPHGLLHRIQKFHKWVHASKHLDDQPFWGIGSQAVFVLLLILFARTL